MTKLIYSYIGPFLWNNAEFVLPFALSNGAAAAFWCTAVESYFGVGILAGTLTRTRT
jgi:hypothetical protein